MTKITTTYNNFSRGKVDHDLFGRYDLPIFSTGADVFTNFSSNFKGNALYRTGLEKMIAFEDCAVIEFEFSQQQAYLCLFTEYMVKFLTYDGLGNFGFVQAGGVDVEITSPYTLEQAKEVQWSQNADVMKMVHRDVAPQDFKRISATSFTFSDSVTTGAGFTVEEYENIIPVMTSNTSPAGTTISATDDNTYAYRAFNDNYANSWRPSGYPQSIVAQVSTAEEVVRYSIRNVNTYNPPKSFNLYGSNDGVAYTLLDTQADETWGTQETKYYDITTPSTYDFYKLELTDEYSSPTVITEIKFYKQNTVLENYPSTVEFKDGRLYYGRDTTVWGSEAGDYEEFTIPSPILDSSPIKVTLADLTEEISWIFSNDRSLICGNSKNIAVINGGDINTAITAANLAVTMTGADGSDSTIPIRKDGLVFYIGKNSRNAYYFNYDLLGETFKSQDANFISYDITDGGIKKLRYMKDRNDLLYTVREDGKMLSLNFNEGEKIVGWSLHETDGEIKDIAQITNNDGDPRLFTLTLRDSVYYIEKLSDVVEFSAREKFFTGFGEEAKLADNIAYNRVIAEELKDCIYLDNSECVENLSDVEITFDGTDTITAASASFTSDDVGKSISYKTLTGYESGRFEITAFTSTTEVTVDVQQTPTANVYSSWYLTFDTITGLDRFDGQDIRVVADGGYLGDFTVASGAIDLEKQVTTACVGLGYTGTIKTFSLGFSAQGTNTQITQKSVFMVGVRLVTSAGGLIGTSRYRLENIQELSQNDINFLPPIPVDGTKRITISDTPEEDKYLYIVQDKPLPFTIAALMVRAKYGIE